MSCFFDLSSVGDLQSQINNLAQFFVSEKIETNKKIGEFESRVTDVEEAVEVLGGDFVKRYSIS